MAKFILGHGYDDAHTDLNVSTTGDSNLYVRGGDLHQRASANVTINDRDRLGPSDERPAPTPQRLTRSRRERAVPEPSKGALWNGLARAMLVLIGLVVMLTTLAVVSAKVAAWTLPLVIVGALLAAYLLALVAMPANERSGLKGFTSVLNAFVQSALRPNRKPERDTNKV